MSSIHDTDTHPCLLGNGYCVSGNKDIEQCGDCQARGEAMKEIIRLKKKGVIP